MAKRRRSPRQHAAAFLLIPLLGAMIGARQEIHRLELHIEAPEQLRVVANQIRQFDVTRFDAIFRLIGLVDPELRSVSFSYLKNHGSHATRRRG